MAGIIGKDLDNCDVSEQQSVKRILVPFNDAKHAPIVFGKALTIAKLYGASICVVSIVNKDLQRSWVNDTPSREKSMSLSSVDILKKGITKLKTQANTFQIPLDYTIIPSTNASQAILSLIPKK